MGFPRNTSSFADITERSLDLCSELEYVTFPSSGVCIHVPIYEIKPSDCSASETFSRKYNAKLDYALLMLVFALWNEGSWVIKKFTLTDSPFLDMDIYHKILLAYLWNTLIPY
ncbi:hypothetical protein CDAR_423221 [Caerostris darwini]|uniref:Uncharacterized protein n=1 Tax=Caerostris darwini TaxID=1538125 RepID=A0AAV4UQP4_9ARAC|nr:hypothetical protein CDAR_423221 [Caerostris darwini]